MASEWSKGRHLSPLADGKKLVGCIFNNFAVGLHRLAIFRVVVGWILLLSFPVNFYGIVEASPLISATTSTECADIRIAETSRLGIGSDNLVNSVCNFVVLSAPITRDAELMVDSSANKHAHKADRDIDYYFGMHITVIASYSILGIVIGFILYPLVDQFIFDFPFIVSNLRRKLSRIFRRKNGR